MNTNKRNTINSESEKDYLQGLFQRLPEEPLPFEFRTQIMQQIMQETIRLKKRNQRLSWIALIFASIIILGLGALAIIYIGFPMNSFSLSMEALQTVPFYIYIAFLALLLLFADHYFRKRYKQKHDMNDK